MRLSDPVGDAWDLPPGWDTFVFELYMGETEVTRKYASTLISSEFSARGDQGAHECIPGGTIKANLTVDTCLMISES